VININDILKECRFETARSGGKGGQNVNKVESKVSIVWGFEDSHYLSSYFKSKIKRRAKSYLFTDGVRITSKKNRSQLDNKQDAIKKLEELLILWLKEEKPRKPTKIPYGVKQKRLNKKKITSTIKKSRGKPKLDD